jgi:hypothetical protein
MFTDNTSNLSIGSVTMDNIWVSGAFFRCYDSYAYPTNFIVSNSYFSSTGNGIELVGNSRGTGRFHNCTFKSDSGVFLREYGPGEVAAIKHAGFFFNSCYFNAPIESFNGTMTNCIIDTRNRTGAALPFQNKVTTHPVPPYMFKDCIFLSAPSTPCISGDPGHGNDAVSGFYLNCLFNNPIYTGATGRMPGTSEYNSINSKINFTYPV